MGNTMMQVQVAKLVGVSSPKRWSQVHVWGELVAVVTLGSEVEGELSGVGTEVIQRLHETYFGDNERQGLERVKAAVERVREEFEEGLVGLVAGVIVEQEDKLGLYLAAVGEAGVGLLRGGIWVNLPTGSGWLKPGDGVVVATRALIEAVGEEEWIEQWKRVKGNAEELVDLIVPKIHSMESSGMAGVAISCRTDFQETKVELPKLGHKMSEIKRQRKWRQWIQAWKEKWGRKLAAEVYVEQPAKRKKLLMTVAGVVGVLLIISLGFGWVRQRTSMETVRLHSLQGEVERLMRESQELIDLNPLRARALLGEAREQVEQYDKEGKKSRAGKEWAEQVGIKLDEALKQATKINEVVAEVWLDLGLVREGSRGETMDFDGENLVVLDKNAEVLLAMVVASKKAGVVGGGQLLDQVKQAAVWEDRGYALSNAGVVELDLWRKTSAVVLKPDSDWGEIGAMDVFGGNLYLLDKQKGQINRYTAIEGGFGARKEWLGKGVEPDFSNVAGMVIDGKIWILTKSGKVEVYSAGTGKAVEIAGLDVPLLEPQAIYTDEDSQKVYILDKGNRRVVVISKEGQYEAQYKWEGIKDATDMVVEEEKKILLLSGEKIYYIEMKN